MNNWYTTPGGMTDVAAVEFRTAAMGKRASRSTELFTAAIRAAYRGDG